MLFLHRGFHVCDNGTKTIEVKGRQYKGDWIYGFPAKSGDRTFILTDNDFAVGYVKMKEVIPETVGMYSSLTDKTGKNICLADIIRYRPANKDHDIFLVVSWDNEKALFYAGFAKLWVINGVCEVVGNIFERPELLQKAES